MKKIVFFMAVTVWLGFTMSASAEELISAENREEIISAMQVTGLSYIGNQGFERSLCFTEDGQIGLTPVLKSGILGAVKKDFDLDGIEEIFMVSYEPSQNIPDGSSVLWFSMLEQNEVGWERASSVELSEKNEFLQKEDLAHLESIWTTKAEEFVFVREYEGEYQFFFENTCFPQYLADGEIWILRGYTYGGEGGFSLIPNTKELSFSGSVFQEVWESGEAPLVQAFHSLGFTAQEIGFGKSACAQEASSSLVIRILAEPIQSLENVSVWMRNAEGELGGFPVTFLDESASFSVDFMPEKITPESDTTGYSVSQTADSEYILPNSDTVVYTMEEIAGLSAQDLKYARNEIFARHGRMFKDAELQSYFDAKSWYVPVYAPEEFDALQDIYLNDAEKANIGLILQAENGNVQGSKNTDSIGEDEIYGYLVEHYRKEFESSGGSGTVMEGGIIEEGIYSTQVRTGVPGNPEASQRLYDIVVNLQDMTVTETNVITNEIKSYSLFE